MKSIGKWPVSIIGKKMNLNIGSLFCFWLIMKYANMILQETLTGNGLPKHFANMVHKLSDLNKILISKGNLSWNSRFREDPSKDEAENNLIHIGEFGNDELDGLGIRMGVDSVKIGTFVNGQATGKKITSIYSRIILPWDHISRLYRRE